MSEFSEDKKRALALLRGGIEGAAEFNRLRYKGGPTLVLEEIDLSGVEFGPLLNLRGVILRRASLRGARFLSPDLRGANLFEADLRECELFEANLAFANLANADLRGASLYGAELVETELAGTNFSQAVFGYTVIASDLSEARGLAEVLHQAWSFITLDTILRSKNIPKAFLRGCGIPDIDIAYLKSARLAVADLRSCFICYATPDEELACRLHDDLQAAGVRCWKWNIDARVGRALWGEITTAIRAHDRVLLIASRSSLASPAVMREIERALQLEDERQQKGEDADVLFPVRIDDFLLDGWEHERKADVVRKVIGDARDWRNPAAYEELLTRLIRDLSQ